MRTASIAQFLASRFRLHMITFQVGGGAEEPLPPDAAEVVDWIRIPSHSRRAAARVARNLSRLQRRVLPLTDRFSNADSRRQVASAVAGRSYRLAFVEHFWCAGYEDLLRGHASRLILDMHNIESALHAGCASSGRWPERWLHRAFAARAEEEERRWLPRYDLVLAASETDRQRMLRNAPAARVAVYPNAIPLRFPAETAEEHCVAFSGNLEYHPNSAAVQYFADQVWPRLKRRDPELRWRLIGKNQHAVKAWVSGDPRIEATGPVDDALAELARVRVVIVPLLAGSGTRIKILEAWAAGRAVVSTRIGAEGLPAAHGENLLLADSPEEMVEQICLLLANPDLRRSLGRAGRRAVEDQLCWPTAWRGLEQSLAGLEEAAIPAADRIGNPC